MPIVTRQILTPEEGLRLSLTGKAELTVLSANDPVFNAPLCQLSFSAGARTFWQCASGGRIFLTLEGRGVIEQSGGIITALTPKTVVRVHPGRWHWIGAAEDTPLTVLSMLTNLPNNLLVYGEEVTEEAYLMALRREA